jgi:hypothetical protein
MSRLAFAPGFYDKVHMHSILHMLSRAASTRLACVALGLFAACATGGARAQEPPREGLLMFVAGGRSSYTLDCIGPLSCEQPSATASKFGVGYQFGTFGVEGGWIDFGRSEAFSTFGPELPSERVQIQAAVVDAAWRWRFGQSFDTVLRAGLASVRHRRTGEGSTNRVSPHFGVGLALELTPAVTLELGWDMTRGKSSAGFTTTVNANTLGLRLRL